MRLEGFCKGLSWAILLIISVACSEFNDIRKSDDWEKKYKAALEYYEEEDYYRANVLLEEVLPLLRGTEYEEKAQFLYAYSHYYRKQYILSAHYFKTFYDTYGRSEYAEEALYRYAYSLYSQSPEYNLDQSSTYEAIQAIQLFINRYPGSENREEATAIIDKLQRKLELKAFDNARLYHQLRVWKSAIIAFDNFSNDYPDSPLNERAQFLKIESSYELAARSIESKKEERFRQTVDYYQEFLDTYPESEYLKEAENIYKATLKGLESVNTPTETAENS
ncbi:outer membrane protein assembly factor BamD [Roseivirga sp. BDSF3-8]|uniref:outer membrane protein assembly factor BamD n=1 Tax=Roseivirga sp. BDSF3-8 TaxID=3241598 RepID=UPI003531E429